MVFWLVFLICILLFIIALLAVKIYFMQKSTDEICSSISKILSTETNILIDISCRDVHIRKLAVRINEELNQLKKERRRLKSDHDELRNSVTNISHDLRTPLTAICGYLELIKRAEKTPEIEKYTEIISERVNVLRQLIEELFKYSVISMAIDNFDFENLELNRLLEESISAHYAIISENKIEPDIFITDKKIIRKLNKNALLRIFQNIIGNAVKYSDGDLIIELKDDGEILFSNHAVNLDEVQVGKLFDRFYTVENAEKSTGLGLYIAKILTEQMGGIITANYDNFLLSIHISFNK